MKCGCCNHDTGDVTLSAVDEKPICLRCMIEIMVEIADAERQRNWRNRFDDGEEEEV